MTNALTNATLDTLQALERAPSVLKVKEVFRQVVEPYGYTWFLCSAPPRADEGPLDPLLFEHWPAAWLERYIERNYVVRDPMVRALYQTIHPFTWREALHRRQHSKADLSIVEEPMAWGMVSGFVVPIYGLGGQVHALSMAGSEVRTDPTARAQIHLIAMYAYARAKQLKRRKDPSVQLSRRQAETLQWAAFGKTDWEVGEILGLSESTVHKHIEAAKRRFGVPTRVQAIVAALRQGTIWA